MYFEFMNKTKLCIGKNALDHLDYECNQYQISHPLVLTDDVLYQLHYIDYLKKHLSLSYSLYTHIPIDSSIHIVEEIKDFYMKEKCDGIIAVGGGSVLDTAKGVCLMLCQQCDSIEDIMGFENAPKGNSIPFFAIPTTSGTGSEATCVAVISHPEKEIKLEIISQHIQSDVAFLDPFFTKNLPIKTTVSTAIDALTHAIESYTCLGKNPLSDAYATSAMKMITQNILKVIDEPHNEDIRCQLALASYVAGSAFSNSMVGIVHAIGHALGAVCHISHGDAMGMLLLPCMRYNMSKNKHIYDDLLLYFHQKRLYAKTPDEQLSYECLHFIENLLKALHDKTKLPIHLNEVIDLKSHIDDITEKAFNDGALIVNNCYVQYQDIIDILEGKYGY